MGRKYLDDLGVTDRHDLWNPNDKRQEEWAKEREEYGFDERETWSLDGAFYCWLYERLKMYMECANVDFSFHKFDYNGKEYTQKELMDMMIEKLENHFADPYTFEDEKMLETNEIAKIWALVLPAMWW